MSVFDLPMTARPGKDAIAGQDELGRTVYRTVTGERYTMPERTEMPAPTMGQRFENLGGLASRAYEGLSVQGAIEAAKGIGGGIISGIVQGFTAPGRALSGEPVSFGDVLATAGMAQVGAAPMRAPAGSLRSGATGGGRPPVTFDDVARAMDEEPLVSERNLGNENSNLIDKIVKDINGEVIERSYDKTFGNGDNAVIRSGDTDLQISVREDGNGIYLTNIASKKAGKQSEVKTGSGVGSKAIEALKKYSDETGKPLAVVGATGSAQKFYEKMGLKPKSVSTYTNEGYITSPSYGPEQQGTGFVYYPSRTSEFSAPAPAPSPSFTLYQGSPHNFAAERLVRMPDGSTQYIVGAPDVLPDVPAGAEVLQDFPLGRQRSDKIGTGEGAQAYGYGLYGAEAEDVAKGYRDRLSDKQSAVDAAVKRFGGVDEAINAMKKTIGQYESGYYTDPFGLELAQKRLAQLERQKSGGLNTGSMYEMQINADPEAFLDWDKPLSEQPDLARKLGFEDPEIIESKRNEALNAFNRATDPNRTDEDYFFGELTPAEKTAAEEMARLSKIQSWGSLKPEDIMKGRRADLNGGRAAVAAAARDKGIPGIKFFDAGSRGAAAGTRNYVIFDENLINIVRKYGIAGAAAMLGVSAIDVEQALADNLPQDQWESLVVGK